MERDRILAARQGDNTAFAELNQTYAPLIDSMTEKYRRMLEGSRDDKEDLRQEASVALYRAVMTYDTEQTKVTFGLYAKICIRNRMISLLRKSRTQQRRRQADVRVEEFPDPPIPATVYRDELVCLAQTLLTDFEKTVFFMYIGGRSYRDMASSLGVTVKSVDNALYRAKSKLKAGLRHGDSN